MFSTLLILAVNSGDIAEIIYYIDKYAEKEGIRKRQYIDTFKQYNNNCLHLKQKVKYRTALHVLYGQTMNFPVQAKILLLETHVNNV